MRYRAVRNISAGLVLAANLLCHFGAGAPALAAAAKGQSYVIAVHISSEKPPAEGPEEVAAIREFVRHRAEALNEAGGVDGHPLEIVFFDDQSDANETKANVERVLQIPNVIAMIGLWNSTRGATVIDSIGASGVPLISELSVESLFSTYGNIFSLTRSVRDEQQVFEGFARDRLKKIAFIGTKDDLYTKAYFEHIQSMASSIPIVSTFWLGGEVEDHEQDVASAIASIKASGADGIFLSVGRKRGAAFLKRLAAEGVTLPVFIGLGSINGIVGDPGGGGRDYQGALYEIAEGGIANLNNERLEQLMRAPSSPASHNNYSPYAVGYGARYADLVAMVAEFAGRSQSPDVESVRRHITDELLHLSEGSRVWRGLAQDWSFTRERTSAERSLLVERKPGEAASTLAPMQYVRMGGAGMMRIPVLYVHLDMVRIFGVDSNEKTFESEFFFTMRSEAAVSISAIEFTNAEMSEQLATPLINIREVHRDVAQGPGDVMTRIYKISGRFRFAPDLGKYPFDQQIFSISFQPASTASAFFIQPPSERVRSHNFSVEGWRIENHYVGTNDLIIRTISSNAGDERIIPYYNFNYTWVMKRQVVDYVLRVIVPLSFILIVAYVAIFIPRSEFEAIMGIQVTALLSAIALYLALSQPGADDATLSDVIFLMAYGAITSMIALSVLEVNPTVMKSETAMKIIHVAQVYLVPAFALATIGIVLAAAAYDLTITDFLKRLRR
jgi:hypothetical protein